MTGDRDTCPPVDLTGRQDVADALDHLLARLGAVYLVVHRLERAVEETLGDAWDLAAHVYGTEEDGFNLDSTHERIDPLEKAELARLVERLASPAK